MKFEDLNFAKEDGIAILTLNRPPMNVFRYDTYFDLYKAADLVASDEGVKAVIVTGSGEKAFCAGADVQAFYELGTSVFNIKEYASNAGLTMRRLKELDVPVIGAANGMALGGGLELLCICDFRIASEKASFGLPEITLGIIPGSGGTVELPYIVGLAKAKEMVMLGKLYNAKEALEMGLVNKIVPPERVMEEAKAFAKELISKPQAALKAAKLILNTGMNMDWVSARRFESELCSSLQLTKDAREGFLSLLEKRKPVYKGEELVEGVKKGMARKREA
jgi:enoyl-CoA hydratase